MFQEVREMTAAKALVLVVDDDYDDLEIIRQILETGGYRTACFTDPMEALERMAEEKPNLVITDLMMKFIDTGLSFTRQIKFDPRFERIPVILITAAFSRREFPIQPRTSDDLAKMAIDAYFDKPVVAEKLLGKVRQLLGDT